MEDYIEMMYRLSPAKKYVRMGELARALNVSPPSVTRMVQRLANDGYVTYQRYGLLELTALGKKTGQRLLERHHLIEDFLKLLGVGENALKDTELIEHIVSDEMVSRIEAFVRYAEANPGWAAWLSDEDRRGQPDPDKR